MGPTYFKQVFGRISVTVGKIHKFVQASSRVAVVVHLDERAVGCGESVCGRSLALGIGDTLAELPI